MSRSVRSLHFAWALLPDGWARDVRLTLRGGLCARIERGVAAAPGEECHALALPGLPNLHSHAFQRGMAGHAERRGPDGDSFWTWRKAMYRFLDRLAPEDMRAIATLAYMEMLETGFTRVGEFHYLHHAPGGAPYADPAEMVHALVAAASETGIAMSLLPVFYAHSGFGGAAPGEGQRRFVCGMDQFARLREAGARALAGLPDAVLGVAPHSLRAATPEELAGLLQIAPEGPVHIHVAEQRREVDDCLAWSGARPVEWLLAHAPVDARWCLVHATHMTDGEAAALAASGAVAGLCPITEANLGDGLFPAEPFLAAGGLYGLGSDSNVLVDAGEEMRLLEYGQRLGRQARNLLAAVPGESCGGAIFRAALAGGARALGVSGGGAMGLVEGGSADIVSLAASHPSFAGLAAGDGWLDGWIFAAGRRAVDCVWRRGERVVTAGHHHARERIVAAYRGAMQRLMT